MSLKHNFIRDYCLKIKLIDNYNFTIGTGAIFFFDEG